MLSREERILGELLVSRGLVERSAVESGGSLADLIAASAAVDPAALAAAREEAKALDSALAPVLPKSGKLGEFRLIREIGRGGMGIVYEAEQEPLGRRVALKLLPAIVALDERRALRFLREAKVAARLYHPGIVPVHASGISEGVLYFAMELIDGENVAQALARGPLPARKAAKIAAEIARALAHAHAAGLVHRDIKPENILLGRDGRARVADFGLVQDSVAESLTLSQHLIGTPAYLAPEQALGKEIDARADVYALGAVLYTMLCGEPPYRGEIPSAVLAQLLHENPPSLRVRAPNVPEALVTICERAMARDPAQRFPSADALAGALEGFVAGIPSDSEDPIAAPPRRVVLRPAWAYALVAALALAGAASFFFLTPKWRSREAGGPGAAVAPVAIPAKGAECCSDPNQERCKRLDYDLSTGVDDAAASPGPITTGGADDDWWVIADPNGTPKPHRATIITPHPRWRDLPGSRWISPNVFGRNGLYVYETCFCVRPGIGDPVLDIAILGDDFVTGMRLNDHAFVLPPTSDPDRCAFDNEPCRRLTMDPAWFLVGRNCLVVEVQNVGGSPNGLEVSASVRQLQ